MTLKLFRKNKKFKGKFNILNLEKTDNKLFNWYEQRRENEGCNLSDIIFASQRFFQLFLYTF